MRSSLNKARNEVGDELTAWREEVGNAELNKSQRRVSSMWISVLELSQEPSTKPKRKSKNLCESESQSS